MKIWGYWATLFWAVVAFLVGQIVALAAFLWWQPGALNTLMSSQFDGLMITFILLIANPITIAVIALAVRLKRAAVFNYLALVWPQPRFVVIGAISLVAVIGIGDAALFFSGQALVTPFQLQSYTSAAAAGWLAALWVAAVIVAPAAEEIVFRGFLFRGWVRSERTAWPAIVVISVLWAGLHVQYDWTGILQIFVVGLYLGWMRWRSGSTLLTFLLHALFNLEGTLETWLQLHFFP
jgi:membrane protease YdiL (CAAX protease family)